MKFKDILEEYINILDCNSNELAKYSNLSPSIISRYKNGDRIPKLDSDKINMLINGIVLLANEKNISNITYNNVKNKFSMILESKEFDLVRNNFNLLIESTNINIASLSNYLGYDPSYLSRIRNGSRKPAYIITFVNGICNYMKNNNENKDKIISLLKKYRDVNINDNNYIGLLNEWLLNNNIKFNYVENFIKNLDSFNLEEYIKVIKFDELKVPTIPFIIPKSKYYYGLDNIKKAELDFLKGTVLSKDSGDVFMCSDMQMDDMASDIDFSKKWMFGLAMLIKKGHHLNVIHNLDRPFNEMMLGLESWIPIYMTGQVSPYYLKDYHDKVYSHLNYVSNNYSLYGECIRGHHKDSKYYLTNNKTELDYYKQKSKYLLKKAKPAMEIYTSNMKKDLSDFLINDSNLKNDRIRILSSLPLHTISEQLLKNILLDNKINNEDIKIIIKYYHTELNRINSILNNNEIIDKISLLNKDEFNKNKISLDLSKYFYDKPIYYSYEQYKEHIDLTNKYALNNKNYLIENDNNYSFKNINIYINHNNYVVISKNNNPNIHFVIRHEKLRDAIEKYNPIVIE